MADRITLTGLRAVGHHGVFEFERREGQEFVVDVVLHVDLARASESDDLSDTVDYGGVAEMVRARITGEPRDLIESVASDIAGDVLADPRVLRVEVTVHKPSAPIAMEFADVSVTVVRDQVR